MTTTDIRPEHIFLTTKEIFDRLKCGRSKGYEVIRSKGFPPKIGMGFRLDTILAWEQAQIDAAALANATTVRTTPPARCESCTAAPGAAPATTPVRQKFEPAAAASTGRPELGPPRTRRPRPDEAAL